MCRLLLGCEGVRHHFMTRIKKTLKVSFPSLIIRRPVQKKVTLTMLWNKSDYVAKEGA